MERMFNGISCKILPQEWDVYFDMALTMLEEIICNNKQGKNTVMIVPVGPTQQYPILAALVNRLNIPLKTVHFFNMDEYMTEESRLIPRDHPLSFYKRMNECFYNLIKPELAMPQDQRHFPHPGQEREYDQRIDVLGGVTMCFGGLGINGHVAFNEPPEADAPMTADEFASIGTHVLKTSRETRTMNGSSYLHGDIAAMPQWCISIGMKQILASGKIYIAITNAWQKGALYHALYDPETSKYPASLLRRNPNLTYVMCHEIADSLMPMKVISSK